MSDYILPEIIEKILLKLPVESLIRFTTVCKSWRCIITSPSFISSHHLCKPKTDNTILLLRHYDEYEKREHYSILEVEDPITIISITDFEAPLKSQAPYFDFVGSCCGVVCLLDDCFEDSWNSIVLWNPSVRKHVVLPENNVNPKMSLFVLGFGFAGGDFKVVGLVFCGRPDNSLVTYLDEVKVFSLRRSSWRRLSVDARLQTFTHAWSQVFVNGVVYWLGGNLVSIDVLLTSILLFRVGQEVFDEIRLPNELATADDKDLSLTLFGESLAVIKYNEDNRCFEVWSMLGYGDESPWTKLYSGQSVDGMSEVVALLKNGEALMSFDDVELVAFGLTNSEVKHLGISWASNVVNYDESLELLGGESDIAKEFSEGESADAEEDLI